LDTLLVEVSWNEGFVEFPGKKRIIMSEERLMAGNGVSVGVGVGNGVGNGAGIGAEVGVGTDPCIVTSGTPHDIITRYRKMFESTEMQYH
jgi:hypothetical protein